MQRVQHRYTMTRQNLRVSHEVLGSKDCIVSIGEKIMNDSFVTSTSNMERTWVFSHLY